MSRVRQLFLPVILAASYAVFLQAVSARLPGHSLDLPTQVEHVLDNDGSRQESLPTRPNESTHRHGHAASAPKGALRERAPSVPYSRTIVAVGDLHGDYDNAAETLLFSGVVDVNHDWSGNVDYFVQTGDIIDRGEHTIMLFDLMEKLRAQAEQAGGKVVSLLGNHEYMNVLPVWDDVAEADIASFGDRHARWKELTTGKIGTSWRANYQVASRLPLHSSFGDLDTDYTGDESSPLSHPAIAFVHGGLPPHYSELTPFPSHINALGRDALAILQLNRYSNLRTMLAVGVGSTEMLSDEEESVVNEDGPLWYRGWANDPEEVVCAEIDDILRKTGTRRMVMGHTRQRRGILSRCGGKIIVIDTGISGYYDDKGGFRSALRIEYTLTPRHESLGKAGPPLWDEREVVTALYDEGEENIGTYDNVISGYF